MPVMITQNYDIQNGIVNGCIGTLERVNYTTDEEGYRHAHSCIIRTENMSGPCLPHLKDHEIAILEDETPLTFTHPHSQIRSVFCRSQLPITPTFALTTHKAQGMTLHSTILDIESCITSEAVYVMLSHVQKLTNIHILRPFHKSKITMRRSEDLQKEFCRLEFLHTQIFSLSPITQFITLDTALGGMHELQTIENWYHNNVQSSNPSYNATIPTKSNQYICFP